MGRSWRERESKAVAFLKKSSAKNFYHAGSWALASPTPPSQRHKSFFGSFFSKKEPLALVAS
jgi:hypothetical protein